MFQEEVEKGRQEAEKELRRQVREGRAIAEQNFTRLLEEGKVEAERQYQQRIQEEREKGEKVFQVGFKMKTVLHVVWPGQLHDNYILYITLYYSITFEIYVAHSHIISYWDL